MCKRKIKSIIYITKAFVGYENIKKKWEFSKYKRYYYHSPNEFIILDLPELKDYKNYDSADLYLYYWFAENVQYYNPQIKQIGSVSPNQKLKVLYLSDFAVMPLKYDMNTYFKEIIGSSERAMIRKSIKNGYVCKQINYDDYLNEILEINTSKGERQGRPMSEDYLNITRRDSIVKKYNSNIYTYGCFDQNETLVAYYMFEKFTNFVHVNKGIGHSSHLNMGIMNYLYAFSFCELSKKHRGLYLVYGGYLPNSSNGLHHFKKHVGCQRKTLVYRGTNEQFEVLDTFLQRYSLRGDSGLNYVRDYIEKKS